MLNKNIKAFVIYITSFSLRPNIIIYLLKKVKILLYSIKKILKYFFIKYSKFVDIFFKKSATKLFKCSSINKNTINIEKSEKLPISQFIILDQKN